MQKLTPDLHHKLNDRQIYKLQLQNISTTSDFLQTDSNKLKQLLNIDLEDLASMKTEFWKFARISPIDGFEHYKLLEREFKCTPTGITSLDNLLQGGLIFGNLIDLCGLSASGKTQLHTTIAVNWSINYNYETIVIDTKGDFSGERIHSMLLNHRNKFTPEKCKQIMCNIRVVKCNNSLIQLIEFLENLLQSVHSYPRFKFLVIDSLPALWFLHHGSKSTNRYRQLATLGDLLRKLAVEHGIAVLTVNIETRLIVSNELIPSPSSDEVDDDDADEIYRMEKDVTAGNRMMVSSIPSAKEILVPALGKHWRRICSIRLQIRRSKGTTTSATAVSTTMAAPPVASTSRASTTVTALTQNPNERIICILKSNQHPTNGCCVVHIKDTGIE